MDASEYTAFEVFISFRPSAVISMVIPDSPVSVEL